MIHLCLVHFLSLLSCQKLGRSRWVINFANLLRIPGQNLCVNLAVNSDYPHFKAILHDSKFSPYLVVALFSSVLAKSNWIGLPILIVAGLFYDSTQVGGTYARTQTILDQVSHRLFSPWITVMTPGGFYQESIQATKLLNRRAVLFDVHLKKGIFQRGIIAVSYIHTLKFFLVLAQLCIKAGIAGSSRHYGLVVQRL